MKPCTTNQLKKGRLSRALETPVTDMPLFSPKHNVTRKCRICITKSQGALHKAAKFNISTVKTLINETIILIFLQKTCGSNMQRLQRKISLLTSSYKDSTKILGHLNVQTSVVTIYL